VLIQEFMIPVVRYSIWTKVWRNSKIVTRSINKRKSYIDSSNWSPYDQIDVTMSLFHGLVDLDSNEKNLDFHYWKKRATKWKFFKLVSSRPHEFAQRWRFNKKLFFLFFFLFSKYGSKSWKFASSCCFPIKVDPKISFSNFFLSPKNEFSFVIVGRQFRNKSKNEAEILNDKNTLRFDKTMKKNNGNQWNYEEKWKKSK